MTLITIQNSAETLYVTQGFTKILLITFYLMLNLITSPFSSRNPTQRCTKNDFPLRKAKLLSFLTKPHGSSLISCFSALRNHSSLFREAGVLEHEPPLLMLFVLQPANSSQPHLVTSHYNCGSDSGLTTVLVHCINHYCFILKNKSIFVVLLRVHLFSN